jgi:hypothetical protein
MVNRRDSFHDCWANIGTPIHMKDSIQSGIARLGVVQPRSYATGGQGSYMSVLESQRNAISEADRTPSSDHMIVAAVGP